MIYNIINVATSLQQLAQKCKYDTCVYHSLLGKTYLRCSALSSLIKFKYLVKLSNLYI